MTSPRLPFGTIRLLDRDAARCRIAEADACRIHPVRYDGRTCVRVSHECAEVWALHAALRGRENWLADVGTLEAASNAMQHLGWALMLWNAPASQIVGTHGKPVEVPSRRWLSAIACFFELVNTWAQRHGRCLISKHEGAPP